MMGFKKWQRAELLIFTLVVIANLLPFISTKFFPSLDGASHLSNSNIINQLVVYHNALFKQFFMLNPEPVPNWTTYVFLSLFNLILPAFLAEKILLIILIGGMPFAFRSLMITISPNNRFYSYLIFPFTHSMFLFFGFYNFCISILFFLITLNYWIKNEKKPWHLKKTILLTLLIVITYFSHIVVFGALLISIALRILTNTSAGLLCKTEDKKTIFRNFLNHTLTITLAALIPLILFFYFFYSRPGTRQITFIAREELIKFIVTVRPLISFNPILEGKITTLIFYLLVTLLGIGVLAFLIFSIVKLFRKNNNLPFLPSLSWWWLAVSSGVFLFLYFSLPDAYGTASYTNLRFGFVFFLIFILWISTFRLPSWIGILAAMIGLYVNILLIRYDAPVIRDMSKIAASCNKASEKIASNSLVLPIYCMDNWFTGHFVDYLSIDKPILMVYNYECVTGYFPVIWNKEKKPNYYMGNPADPKAYINFEETKGHSTLPLDYVFIVGNYDPNKDWFFSTLHHILTEDFSCIYTSEYCQLYQNKKH